MANYHVIKNNKKGAWAVKKSGAERSSRFFDNQNEAKKNAKKFASKSGGGEVRVHDRKGRIRGSNTVSPKK